MRFRRLGLLALSFGCVGVTACTSPASDGRSGSVEVVTRRSAALSAADVARVAVTVSGDNIPTPISDDLTADGATWHGTISDIPVGIARFDGVAYDASNTRIYVGGGGPRPVVPRHRRRARRARAPVRGRMARRVSPLHRGAPAPPEYRGPEHVAHGVALADDGFLTPRTIGDAARSGRYDLDALKRVWHYVARFGR
ncbi:MAG: hypothetical protein JWP87_2047 [Labilithrix sp.]|nr:hypothetical protein [Labilithrix sp.]